MAGRRYQREDQRGRIITVLGVTFNFVTGQLEILEDRRNKVRHEIVTALKTDTLHPGRASKLKGKLLFICGHFAARHGRTHLRALAERQYASNHEGRLGGPLRRALEAWVRILDVPSGTRRLYTDRQEEPASMVIFTDGSHPDMSPVAHCDNDPPRIGWVSFEKG